jgi:hypothetical protein
MKINIIGDQILFHLEPGSLNPNSRFFISSLSENVSSAAGLSPLTSSSSHSQDESLREYQSLLLEEKRCLQILQNIQKKLNFLRPALGDANEDLSGEESDATVAGYSLFFTAVAIMIFVFGK